MKVEVYNAKVDKVPVEIENRLKNNAELFFKDIEDNLKDKIIYSDESLDFLEKMIKKITKDELTEDQKWHFFILIGCYFGQYILTQFKGDWIFEKNFPIESPSVCFIGCGKNGELAYFPFAILWIKMYRGNKFSLKAEIISLKNKISHLNKIDTKSIFRNSKKI